MCRKRLSSPRCRYELIDSAWVVIVPGQKCINKKTKKQHCLSVMLDKWSKALDNGKIAGALLTDLSKAFNCLHHELLIAKLEAYGFDQSSLSFIYSYLSDRKQRTKVNNSYSSWSNIKSGVPQGSILCPLLFNIYLNYIFYFVSKCDIANYADDTTPCAVENTMDAIWIPAH